MSIPVEEQYGLKTVSDHGSYSGRNRGQYGPDLDWSGFVPHEKNVSEIDPYSLLPNESSAIGQPNTKIYWPDKLSAPRGTPSSTYQTGGVDLNEHVATWHHVAPAFIDLSNDRPRSKLLRDLNLDQSRIHDSLKLVDLSKSPFPPCLGSGGGSTTSGGTTTVIGTPSGSLAGIYDQGRERLTGRIVGAPVASKHPILWAAGAERGGSHVLGFPSFTNVLYLDWQSPAADKCQFTTRIADLTDEFAVDPTKTAALSTFAHVVSSIENSCSVAWNGAPAPGNPLAGRGQMTDAGYFPQPKFQKKPPIVFYAARSGGGPLSGGGGAGDQHAIANVDGTAHVCGHLDLSAPWYASNAFDAPPKVDFEPYEETGPYGGVWVETLMRVDNKKEKHVSPGAKFGASVKVGLVKWQSRHPIIVFPPRYDPPPPPEDEPPKSEPQDDGLKPFPIPPFPELPLPGGVIVDPFDGGNLVEPPIGPLGPLTPFPIPGTGDPFEDPFLPFPEPFIGPRLPLDDGDPDDLEGEGEQILSRVGAVQMANVDTYARMWNYLAQPGLMFTPSLLNVDDGDNRFNMNPTQEEQAQIRCAAPSALLLPFGKQDGGTWDQIGRKGDAHQFYTGAIQGGIGVYPPTKNIDPRVTARTTVETIFTLCNDGTTPEVFLGWGCPTQIGEAAGKVANSFVDGVESSKRKTWSTGASGDRELELMTLDNQGAMEIFSRIHKQTSEPFDFTAQVGRTHYVDTDSFGAVEATIPDSTTVNLGERITLTDSEGTFGTSALTLTASGSDTIDGASSYVLSGNYDTVTLEAESNGWSIIGGTVATSVAAAASDDFYKYSLLMS